MALFGSKKNTEKKVTAEAAAVKASAKPAARKPLSKAAAKAAKKSSAVAVAAPKAGAAHASTRHDYAAMILGPRITEKATLFAEKGVYSFNVHERATKESIAKAMKDVYNVVPAKIRIARVPEKHVFSRGKAGVKQGGKKAYVYMKAGEKIDIV